MSFGRFLSIREYEALKAAFRDLVGKVGGPVRGTTITRVSQQQISRCQSGEAEFADRFPTIDVIADFEADCGDPVVTRHLAEKAGFMLVPIPRARRTNDADLVGRVSDLLAEISDVSGGVARALKDNRLTPAERDALAREVREAQISLAEVLAGIDLRAAQDREGGDE